MEVVLYPSEVLKTVCTPVDVFDDALAKLIDEMAVTMYAERGVGIAAPQVGITKSILLIDPSSGDKAGDFKSFINPKILWSSRESIKLSEGCLSIPGVIVSLQRPQQIEVEYQDTSGAVHVDRFDAWSSRIIQHEIDHLHGKVILDQMETAPRIMLMRRARAKRKEVP